MVQDGFAYPVLLQTSSGWNIGGFSDFGASTTNTMGAGASNLFDVGTNPTKPAAPKNSDKKKDSGGGTLGATEDKSWMQNTMF